MHTNDFTVETTHQMMHIEKTRTSVDLGTSYDSNFNFIEYCNENLCKFDCRSSEQCGDPVHEHNNTFVLTCRRLG